MAPILAPSSQPEIAPLFTISFQCLFLFFKKKLFPHGPKSTLWWLKYHRAVMLSWAFGHFDFQKLAGLWLAGKVVYHVEIYRSKVVEGFSAFQIWSCVRLWWDSNLILLIIPWWYIDLMISNNKLYWTTEWRRFLLSNISIRVKQIIIYSYTTGHEYRCE